MLRSTSDLRVVILAAGVAFAGAACILPSPDYEGTQFACAEPPSECPAGFTCIDGMCVDDDSIPQPDPPDAGPVDVPDADVADETPDADATGGGGDPVTLTFGDRADADVTGVTTDTYLEEDFPDETNGANQHIGIDADPREVGLIRFDVTAIPETAAVIEATLEVYIDNPIEDGTFELHILLESWDEATATWNQRADGTPWTAPGAGPGSFVPVPVGATAPPEVGPIAVPLKPSLVELWLAEDSNHGIRWSAASPLGRGGNFLSREEEQEAKRPLLRVTYQE